MWVELEQTQESLETYSTSYIIAVCLLAVCSGTAVVLPCFHFAKLRAALTKLRKGIPVSFETARKSLQDLLKLRKLSVGDLENNISRNNQNLPYTPYPNMNPTYFGNPTFNVPNLSYPNPTYGYPTGQAAPAIGMPTTSAPTTGVNPIQLPTMTTSGTGAN